jgi:hypothetical protein
MASYGVLVVLYGNFLMEKDTNADFLSGMTDKERKRLYTNCGVALF